MKLPIEAYGNRILKQKSINVPLDYPELNVLIENMWETMKGANGCGLAAPQVGKPIKLFIVDTQSTFEALTPEERTGYFEKNDNGISETFINAQILNYSPETWGDYEGCLSIPEISKEVKRPWSITINYYDSNLEEQLRTFDGYTARVVQHEYDHTEGILYIDYLNQLSKKMIEGKLKKILKGQIITKYLMKYKK